MRWIILGIALATLASARGQEDEGRALHARMLRAFSEAPSLSYVSDYRWEAKGDVLGACRYVAQLRKPNEFRIDAWVGDEPRGTLIGDGRELWVFWPGLRPRFHHETDAEYESTKEHVYVRKAAPPGGHSIGHETVLLGAGMSMPVLDPSTFHGYTESLAEHVTGIAKTGVEDVAGEPCDVIRVEIMQGQRVRELWLARSDHLPRKLRETVHVSYDIVTEETWRDVRVGEELMDAIFRWTPPDSWRRWRMPSLQSRLLPAGALAPDFELIGADKRPVRLSALRGKVLWLNFWRVG